MYVAIYTSQLLPFWNTNNFILDTIICKSELKLYNQLYYI